MKNDDKPGFQRAQRFVKRDAHQFNAQREHQKRLKAKRLDNALLVISRFLLAADCDISITNKTFAAVEYARSFGFNILKEKDNG